MIFTIITSLILVLLVIFNYKLTKDILAPSVILSFVYAFDFMMFVIFNLITGSKYWLDYRAFYFAIGVIIFTIGFMLFYKLIIGKNNINLEIEKQQASLTIISKCISIAILIISILTFIHFIYTLREYIGTNVMRIFNANKIVGYRGYTGYMYIQTFVLTSSFVYTYILFFKKLKKTDCLFCILPIISMLLFGIMNGSRTILFKIVIITGFIVLYSVKRKNVAKVFILGFISLVILTAILTLIMHQPLSIDFARGYLNSGVVAFLEWAKTCKEHYNGTYTFRLLFAILNKLGIHVAPVRWIEMGYIDVPELDWGIGNVYTFYHGYAQDFGLIYALFIQFVVSLFHGLLYGKAMLTKKPFWIVLLCVFYYPLVMQFFTDNYFVMLSYWIQITLIIFIYFKTKILYIDINSNNENLSS